MNTLDRLKMPFRPDQVHWRVGPTSGKKGIALAYIDARDVMKRLDDVCGALWQCKYPFPGCCEVGIHYSLMGCGCIVEPLESNEWLWRSNGAGETNMEGEKGQYSDAFKRAAVMWGIGRYLYFLPNVWCDLDDKKRIINPPSLPEWATPEGFSKQLEKQNGSV